jgi:predicted nucleic acid-binding protein
MGSLADLTGKRVCLDANVFIYALDDLPPWNAAAGSLLRAAEAGEFVAVTSELTLAECLVKPFQTGSQASVHVYEQTIRSRRWLTVVPVSREVLIEAARVRATSAAKLPDAIHIASYRLQNANVFVTNDQPLKGALGMNCLLLSEFNFD